MLSQQEALRMLQSGEISFPPFSLDAKTSKSGSRRTEDVVFLKLGWNGTFKEFKVIYKEVATPKKVGDALREAAEYASSGSKKLPLLLVPFLTDHTLQRLEALKVSGLDLCGNAVLFAEPWLVHRTGNPNCFPSSQPIKNVYEGKSALVGRVLLSRPHFDFVSDVRNEIECRGGTLSMGTVSKVLKALEEDLIVSKSEGIALLQPTKLLHNIAHHYKGVEVKGVIAGKADLDTSFYSALREHAKMNGIRCAGRSEALYAISPTSGYRTRIYVSRLGPWLDALPFQKSERFANLEFVETQDEGVYFDPHEHDGFTWCSKLQIYLELYSSGKREREISLPLQNDLLRGLN